MFPQTPYRLMITGSTRPTAAEIATAKRAVNRAAELGYTVLVADMPGVNGVVIDECNCLEVRYACVYLGSHARHEAVQVAVRAPATCRFSRDRWMVDHSDHVLGIYRHAMNNTPAALQYAKRKGKPADLLTPRAIVPVAASAPKLSTVQAIIDVQHSSTGLAAQVGLLALDAAGTPLRTAQIRFALICPHPDHAKLEAIVAVMKHLSSNGTKFGCYMLHIEQSSSHVVKWLQHGYQRSSQQVQTLLAEYETLKDHFAQVTVSQCDRASLHERLATLTK